MPIVVIKKDEDEQQCCNVLCRLNGDQSAVGSPSARRASPLLSHLIPSPYTKTFLSSKSQVIN